MSKPSFAVGHTTGEPYILQLTIHDAGKLTPEELNTKLATIGEMIQDEHAKLLQWIDAKTAPMA